MEHDQTRTLSWRPFIVSDEPLNCAPGFNLSHGRFVGPNDAVDIQNWAGKTAWIAEPATPTAWFDLPQAHPWRALLKENQTKEMVWKTRTRDIVLGMPQIMGILNITPDSFSNEPNPTTSFAEQAMLSVADGADILDIGAEATNLKVAPISPEQEIARLADFMPALDQIRVPLSIDTYHEKTMRWAADRVDIINDIGMTWRSVGRDQEVFCIVRDAGLGYVLMAYHEHDHAFDSVETCLKGIIEQLDARLAKAFALGIDMRQIIVDPGIGFGKGIDNDHALITRAAPALACLGRPVLIAHSRKRCLGNVTGRDVHHRDNATAIGSALAIVTGAKLVRVHDPKGSVDARAMTYHDLKNTIDIHPLDR